MNYTLENQAEINELFPVEFFAEETPMEDYLLKVEVWQEMMNEARLMTNLLTWIGGTEEEIALAIEWEWTVWENAPSS